MKPDSPVNERMTLRGVFSRHKRGVICIAFLLLIILGSGLWIYVYTGNMSNWQSTHEGSLTRRVLAWRIESSGSLIGLTKKEVMHYLGEVDDEDVSAEPNGEEVLSYVIGQDLPYMMDDVHLNVIIGRNGKVHEVSIDQTLHDILNLTK